MAVAVARRILLLLALSSSSSCAPPRPFNWSTIASASYTFCYNASGPLSEAALNAIARTRLMVHGMNAAQEQAPAYRQSEDKVIV